MKKRFIAAAAGVAALAVIVTGCSGTDAPAGGETQTSNEGTSASINLYQKPKTFNPLALNGGAEQLTASLLYDNLVTLDAKGEFVPRLAKSWDVSEDATTYTFHLQPDLKWSDGEALTAEDVVYTYNLYANPAVGSSAASRLAGIEGFQAFKDGTADHLAGVTAPDENTVEFKLANPNLGFVANIGYGAAYYIMPEHALKDMDVATLFTNEWFQSTDVVGSGPYTLADYKVDQQVELKANPNFREKVGIETLYLKMLTTDVATTQLASGEIDLVQLGAGDVASVEGLPGVTVAEAGSPGFLRLVPNFDRFPDAKVRQAFLYAIDRKGLIEGPLSGHGAAINSSFLAPSVSQKGMETYDYDPKKAKALLEEAGFDFAKEIKVTWIPGTADRDQAMTVVLKQLQDIGVNAVANQIDAAAQVDILKARDYDLMLSGGGSYMADPSTSAAFLLGPNAFPAGANTAYFNDAKLDGVLTSAAASTDKAEREGLYQDAAKLDNELVPVLWLYNPNTIWATSGRLQGFEPSGDFTNGFFDAAKWTVSG